MNFETCPDPVFIIGAPRSGTSILAWSLHQHHQWFTTSDESDILSELFGDGNAERVYREARERPGGGDWLARNEVSWPEFVQHLGFGVNTLFTSRSGGKRWIDQTPRNTLMVDVLADMFPGAVFLHVLRDGRRVVHSMVNFVHGLLDGQLKEEFLEQNLIPDWARGFREACRTWSVFVERSLDFCARNPGRSLTVQNERLVTDTEAGFAEILEFLGVPPSDAPAAFFRDNRVNSSFPQHAAPSNQLAKPWEHWTPEQHAIFAEEAGETMHRSGLQASYA
jgi:Sulfotransferase family